MKHCIIDQNSHNEITSLFTSVFSESEGVDEGKLIGSLASDLSSNIDNKEIICIGAYEDSELIGAIFFTHLSFDEKAYVYMLAPIAVSTKFQGKGVGQSLIHYGLNELKSRSVEVVITYGDPAFYSKVGFSGLSESVIQAPLKLSMPVGWLAQSLTTEPIPVIKQRPTCVKEFVNPVYW